jgi:hypothetical protein
MNCFEDSEDENILMAKGASAVLLRLIESNQARILQWRYQNSFLHGGDHSGGSPDSPEAITTNTNTNNAKPVKIDGNTNVSVLGKTTRFDSAYVPEISIEDYVERVQTYSKCSTSVYVIAMVYIDRLIEGEGLVVTQLNVHRLFITAFLIAAKFYDDLSFKNAFYATLGGIEKTEMNLLEVDFLNYIKFNLVVAENVYNSYRQHMLVLDNNNPISPLTAPYSPTSITQSLSFSTNSSVPDWQKMECQEHNANSTVFFVQD